MPRPSLAVVLLMACVVSGCAATAMKPPTPADEITSRQAAAIKAPPGERFFVLIFGSQTVPKLPKYCHSWVTLVKVTGCGGPGRPCVEEHSISWMPATLDVRICSLYVEPGTNLNLHATMADVLRHKERVSVWGPYEVGPGLAHRFLVQKAFMESGQVGYQAVDSIGEAARTGAGCDCIHAVTDMDPLFDRTSYPLTFFGDSASLNMVRQIHVRPLIISPEADHGWLLPLLGLDQYPLVRRQYSGRIVPSTPENVEAYLRSTDRK
jgi:hypothetical protein